MTRLIAALLSRPAAATTPWRERSPQEISPQLGQPVVIDNRPGASASCATRCSSWKS